MLRLCVCVRATRFGALLGRENDCRVAVHAHTRSSTAEHKVEGDAVTRAFVARSRAAEEVNSAPLMDENAAPPAAPHARTGTASANGVVSGALLRQSVAGASAPVVKGASVGPHTTKPTSSSAVWSSDLAKLRSEFDLLQQQLHALPSQAAAQAPAVAPTRADDSPPRRPSTTAASSTPQRSAWGGGPSAPLQGVLQPAAADNAMPARTSASVCVPASSIAAAAAPHTGSDSGVMRQPQRGPVPLACPSPLPVASAPAATTTPTCAAAASCSSSAAPQQLTQAALAPALSAGAAALSPLLLRPTSAPAPATLPLPPTQQPHQPRSSSADLDVGAASGPAQPDGWPGASSSSRHALGGGAGVAGASAPSSSEALLQFTPGLAPAHSQVWQAAAQLLMDPALTSLCEEGLHRQLTRTKDGATEASRIQELAGDWTGRVGTLSDRPKRRWRRASPAVGTLLMRGACAASMGHNTNAAGLVKLLRKALRELGGRVSEYVDQCVRLEKEQLKQVGHAWGGGGAAVCKHARCRMGPRVGACLDSSAHTLAHHGVYNRLQTRTGRGGAPVVRERGARHGGGAGRGAPGAGGLGGGAKGRARQVGRRAGGRPLRGDTLPCLPPTPSPCAHVVKRSMRRVRRR